MTIKKSISAVLLVGLFSSIIFASYAQTEGVEVNSAYVNELTAESTSYSLTQDKKAETGRVTATVKSEDQASAKASEKPRDMRTYFRKPQ